MLLNLIYYYSYNTISYYLLPQCFSVLLQLILIYYHDSIFIQALFNAVLYLLAMGLLVSSHTNLAARASTTYLTIFLSLYSISYLDSWLFLILLLSLIIVKILYSIEIHIYNLIFSKAIFNIVYYFILTDLFVLSYTVLTTRAITTYLTIFYFLLSLTFHYIINIDARAFGSL